MIGYVRQLTPIELDGFRLNPRSIKEFLHEETLSGFPPAARTALERLEQTNWWRYGKRRELMKQVSEAMNAPGASDHIIANRRKGLCLEKYWHELHYLLTGQTGDAPAPLGDAILGGTPIGDNLGYGPARFLMPEEVRAVSVALACISKGELARRCAEQSLQHKEAHGFLGEDGLEDTLYFFDLLVQYYAEAAERGNAVLLYIR